MKFTLSRSVEINKSLAEVRALVANFEKWPLWSPWTVVEPDHQRKVSGDAGVVGHFMSWEGKNIGSGEMEMTESTDNCLKYDLRFLAPWKSTAKTSFDFEKTKTGGTKVTWNMEGSMPFFLFFMISTMKSWIEMDYDRGLAMLKGVAENGKVNAQTTNEGIVDFEGFKFVGLKHTSSATDMKVNMPMLFERLMLDLQKKGARARHWITVYPKIKMAKKLFTYIAGASIEDLGDKSLGDDYIINEIPTGKMLKITHKGSYKYLGNAWSMGMMVVRGQKMKQTGYPFEYYHNNPDETPEDELVTDIYFPVKA